MDTLLLLLGGLGAALWATDRWARHEARKGARRALADAEALFSGTHEIVSVDASRFGWLDHRFYDAQRDRLLAQGFQVLGDVEDLTVTRQHPHMRTFIRGLSGDDGQVMVGLYQVKLRGPMAPLQWLGLVPRRIRIFDVSSVLSDGRFVATNNTQGIDTTPNPSHFDVLRLPVQTDPRLVLERHRERLRAALETSPGVEAERVRSLNAAMSVLDRMQRAKNEVMQDREALVQTIEGTRGLRDAKDRLIEEVRRA